MSENGLKLTVYFGERDRLGGRFLADALLDIFARHGLAASLLMRGVEGFGAKHLLRSDRLLSLSEDLPLVAVAVDRRERIEAVVEEVERLRFAGLVTLERARLLGADGGDLDLTGDLHAETKLTLYIGRGTRANGRPSHQVAVEVLHRHGIAGATVLLGVDGTLRGRRRRARFFGRNADVPAMVISVGSGELIGAALEELAEVLEEPTMTVERIQVLKRDGNRLAMPAEVPERDEDGMGLWQKLMLYSSEQTHFDGRPVHVEAIRRLRRGGASGATALRGVWGYDGRHPPHGDTIRSLRRRVPTLTVVVDIPANARRWFRMLDEITPNRGLITSEVVPAFRTRGPEVSRGGLRLARHLPSRGE